MITIKYNDETGLFDIFTKENNAESDTASFNYVLTTLREYRCTYKGKGCWTVESPFILFSLYNDISSMVKVLFSEDDQALARDLLFPKDETSKRVKLPINKDFFIKHPPILGKGEFVDFQMKSIKFLSDRNRGIASITMGGGKTYIMCGVIANLLYNNKIDKIVWVCRPEGLVETKLKILFFLSDYYKEDDIDIITTENRAIEDFFDKKILLISYNTFRLTTKYYQNLRATKAGKTSRKPKKTYIDFTKWDSPDRMIQILDEGQAIKNDSLQTNSFLVYKEAYNYRYILSGTIGYKVDDYYYPLKYLVPKSLPPHSEWKRFLYKPSKTEYYKEELVPEALDQFKQAVIDPFQIVYGKECLDLPDFREEKIYIDMSSKMRKLYQTFVNDIVESLNNEEDDDYRRNILKSRFAYYSLFTSDPSLVSDKFNFSWNFEDNPKIEIVNSLLDKYIKEEGRKVIIWSNHPKVINNLGTIIKKYEPFIIHGEEKTSLKKKDRHAEVQKFRGGDSRNLLLTSYVLNSSIDIPEATRTIYWDLIVDNDRFEQSKNRHHRLGQKEITLTNYLMFDRSVDIYIWDNILQPKADTRELMTTEGRIDIEALKKIFLSKARFTVS